MKYEVVEQIQPAQHRVQWQSVVITLVTFGFHKRRGSSWPSERLSSFQEPSCTELVNKIYENVGSIGYNVNWFLVYLKTLYHLRKFRKLQKFSVKVVGNGPDIQTQDLHECYEAVTSGKFLI
jgi:hypothetical protein